MNIAAILLGGVQLAQSILEIYNLWAAGQIGDKEALHRYRETIANRIKAADAAIDEALGARKPVPGEFEDGA